VPSAAPFSFRKRIAWIGLAICLLLAALSRQAPPNGHEHAALAQYFGRFHPVLVHLPIGLIFLVPILELAGGFGRRDDLRGAAGFVLGLATAAALAAALDGWLLAWSGGYGGPLVIRHMWSGVELTMLCLLTAWLRARFASEPRRWPGFVFVYGPLLVATVALMAWTGHQGGQLSHGENFLTEEMPAGLRSWLGLPAPAKPAAPARATGTATVYTARIAPIFTRSCVSCHNPNKIKGDLRLDSYAQLMRGGEDGAVVVPWRPQDSDLLRRITLPPDDDDHMPNNGKNPLSPAEIKLIERWIAGGASDAQPLDSIAP
jgi:uncharacterized membrane protein/mono/diheme cytochrome c family protein